MVGARRRGWAGQGAVRTDRQTARGIWETEGRGAGQPGREVGGASPGRGSGSQDPYALQPVAACVGASGTSPPSPPPRPRTCSGRGLDCVPAAFWDKHSLSWDSRVEWGWERPGAVEEISFILDAPLEGPGGQVMQVTGGWDLDVRPQFLPAAWPPGRAPPLLQSPRQAARC